MKRLLLDGFNLAFRAYHALPELTRSDGVPTGALHGWIKTLWKLSDDHQPDAITAFFDLEGSTRHLALQADYKAQRKEMPEPLQQQIPAIKELTRLCGVQLVEQSGVEADDLIGSAATHFAQAGDSVIVVSADKDLAQLVSDTIRQLLPAPTANPRIGWRLLDPAAVEEKFGVTPQQIPDYLALVGDTSDNIPGIPGVGPKTAVRWIRQWQCLDAIIANCEAIEPKRFAPVVAEMRQRLLTNREMTTLQLDLPPPPPHSGAVDLNSLVKFLDSMEMKRSATEAWDRYGLLGGG